MNIIRDYFSNTERPAPGNREITLKALSFINGLSEKSKFANIGCGAGGQTMVLTQNTKGIITGVNLWSDYIDRLNLNVQKQNLQHRVKVLSEISEIFLLRKKSWI